MLYYQHLDYDASYILILVGLTLRRDTPLNSTNYSCGHLIILNYAYSYPIILELFSQN